MIVLYIYILPSTPQYQHIYDFLQVVELFPSAQGLEVTWSSVVKIGQSLYREAPGNDPFRPDQKTLVKNFFLSGSYTKQVFFIYRNQWIRKC